MTCSVSSPSSTSPVTAAPSGKVSVNARVPSFQSGRIRARGPISLLFISRPSAAVIQKRRSPATPPEPSSTSSGNTSPSAFTGAIWMRVTVITPDY